MNSDHKQMEEEDFPAVVVDGVGKDCAATVTATAAVVVSRDWLVAMIVGEPNDLDSVVAAAFVA